MSSCHILPPLDEEKFDFESAVSSDTDSDTESTGKIRPKPPESDGPPTSRNTDKEWEEKSILVVECTLANSPGVESLQVKPLSDEPQNGHSTKHTETVHQSSGGTSKSINYASSPSLNTLGNYSENRTTKMIMATSGQRCNSSMEVPRTNGWNKSNSNLCKDSLASVTINECVSVASSNCNSTILDDHDDASTELPSISPNTSCGESLSNAVHSVQSRLQQILKSRPPNEQATGSSTNIQQTETNTVRIQVNQTEQIGTENDESQNGQENANGAHFAKEIAENLETETSTQQPNTSNRGLIRGLRRLTNWLPHFSKGAGKQSKDPESTRFVSAISVPNLSLLASEEDDCNVRSHSDPAMQSKSLAFGLNHLVSADEHLSDKQLVDHSLHNPTGTRTVVTTSTPEPESIASSLGTSKSSFTKNANASKSSRPARFEPKMALSSVPAWASTLPPNLSAPQYASCLCLHPPAPPPSATPELGVMVSSVGSSSLYSSSSMATLPTHVRSSSAGPVSSRRYLTYGTSAQLQQEYGKALSWHTRTEFRLSRKFRRLKRRAKKLLPSSLLSSKSFLRRFASSKRGNSHSDLSKDSATQQAQHQFNTLPATKFVFLPASRSSSLTSLLELIEDAQGRIDRSHQSPKMPPKCPPRLKRAQSTLNLAKPFSASPLRTGTMPKSVKQLAHSAAPNEKETGLWKPNTSDYQIAFIDQTQLQQTSPIIQGNRKAADPDTISVKSLDSYFGATSLPSLSTAPSVASPKAIKTLVSNAHTSTMSKSKSRTMMARSTVGITNVEDWDFEESNASGLNSLDIESNQGMDSISMVANDAMMMDSSEFNNQQVFSKKESRKFPESSLESSKVSLQSSSSTSGFSSEPKNDSKVEQTPESGETDSGCCFSSQSEAKEADNQIVDNSKTSEPPESSAILEKAPETIKQPSPPPPVYHQCDDTHVYAVPIKKPKPPLMVKPKVAPKEPAEPIYARPNKSKYPPKHCCIHRPAVPPPEAPNKSAIARSLKNQKAANQQLRRKVKAPAPQPPASKAMVARPVVVGPGKSELSTKLSPSTAVPNVPGHPKMPKNGNNRLKLNTLLKKNASQTTTTNAGSKSKSAKFFNSKGKPHPTVSSPPTSTTTRKEKTVPEAAPRSTSKSPFKALINRLNPRNQDEGHHPGANERQATQPQQQQQPPSVESQSVAKESIANQSLPSIEADEPIYSNVNSDIETIEAIETTQRRTPIKEHFKSGTPLPSVPNEPESDITSSVVNLIDKFNKLIDTPVSPIVSPKMAPKKSPVPTSTSPFPQSVRFESILSNNNKTKNEGNLENEFQQYLHQFRSNSPDKADQKQLVDQLCSELMTKFENQKQPAEKERQFAAPITPEKASPVSENPINFWLDRANSSIVSGSQSQDLSNPNWLFLFFLHNQRQMFKEILHEMLNVTIQKQYQNQQNPIQSNKEEKVQFENPLESPSVVKSEEMNEFKQLIQMLQSTIAANATSPSAPQTECSAEQQIVPIGTVTANVVSPEIRTTKQAFSPKNNKKNKKKEKKVKKAKEKKNTAKKSTKVEPDAKPTDDAEKSESSGEPIPTTGTANVKSSNRFVNKIVLNNSINQFNFTMNQEGGTSPTSSSSVVQPQPPAATIVNVFSDESNNQAANLFDINVAPGEAEQQGNSSDESEEEEETEVVTNANQNVNSDASKSHRTVLQIKDPSGHVSPSSGFLSTLRYRLEKKRTKKLIERFKKEQLAASQINLLDAIKESEEMSSVSTQPKVTLSNTSKLEIKVASQRSPDYGEVPCELPQPKMGTLRRLFSSSKSGANKRDKLKLPEEMSSSRETVSNVDHLVARHRRSQYLPQISDPFPSGIEREYSLFGTVGRSGGGRDLARARVDIPRSRLSLASNSSPARSLSERNFRSISVIKLNELPDYEDEPRESIGRHHRQYVRNSRGGGPMDRIMGGSQLNLSSSSLSSSVALPVMGRRAARGYPTTTGSQYFRNPSANNNNVYNSSDDFDDEQSTTSSRSKMVTFTLPRSFKKQSKTLHGGVRDEPRRGQIPVESDFRPYNADPNRYHPPAERRRQPSRYVEETEDFSETDQTDQDFTELESEMETDEQRHYYLTPSRLNERYFR